MKRWSKSNKLQIGLISAAAVLTAAALTFNSIGARTPVATATWTVPDVTHAEITAAFTGAGPWTKAPNGTVRAGIVPHHGLVSPMIAGWFASLQEEQSPATVVIIGPDHENRGAGYLTTARVDWVTPEGLVRVHTELVDDLVETDHVVIDEGLLQSEHGVYTVLPYVRRAWPAARVVTIAVKGDARPDRINRLAQVLVEKLDVHDIVLATVDFSHYTTAIDALAADQESLGVIERGDATAAFSIPVDSPPAISLVLEYAKRRSLTYQQLFHTTSAQFVGQPDVQSVTSYLSAYFVSAN